MLISATCKNCGKEFEYEGTGGRRRAYCSTKCKNKRDNRIYSDIRNARLGEDYWKWRYHNDSEYREKRKSDNTAWLRKRREEKRAKARDDLITQIRDAKTLEEAAKLFDEKARIRSENYS